PMTLPPILERHKPPTALLHLGLHKTGSTYIQSLCYHNVSALKRNGILYPTGWPTHSFRQHSLADEVRRPATDRAALAFYLAKIADSGDHALISSEDFSLRSQDEIASLRDALKGRRCISIIYFRRHAGFLRSYWDEMVKHGETGSAEDWVAT